MAARIIRPISPYEFTQMMQNAKPPVGWSQTIAVANSGGPDSICLMFLINRFIKDQHRASATSEFPKSLVSFSINHDLQASSIDMATHASRIAQSLDVRHVTHKLDWGAGGRSPKPGPDDKIEELARDMRYEALLSLMIASNANSLALGHHCDDQVETMLMRLGRSSTHIGLGGMRPCRRWGMGTEIQEPNRLQQVEQMRRWIVRPLLSVGKDRILATCEEQKLEYVSDPTNFQPQLTIRNAIRHVINNGGNFEANSISQDFPLLISSQLRNINNAAVKEYHGAFNLTSNIDHLRKISSKMGSEVQSLDQYVNDTISKCRIPSPPGTFMISPLSLIEIDSRQVREALLYRITRYVSPEPWGSPRAELGRRKASMDRLWERLSSFEKYSSQDNNSICVGSGVWWRMVAMIKGRLRSDVRNVDSVKLAWIALRQPQPRSSKVRDFSRCDITCTIIHARNAWLARNNKSPVLEMTFDNRYIIRFSLDKIPESILESVRRGARIVIEPWGIWFMPQARIFDANGFEVIHTDIAPEPFSVPLQFGKEKHHIVKSSWIVMEYFRPLSAI